MLRGKFSVCRMLFCALIKMYIKRCPHCNLEIHCLNGRGFSNHVRWCTNNPNKYFLSGDGFKQKVQKSRQQQENEKLGEVKKFLVVCEICKKSFYVQEHEYVFPTKEKYFCSKACSHSRCFTEEHKKHISEGMRQWRSKNNPIKTEYRICPNCHTKFVVPINKKKKFCCSSCARKYTQNKLYDDYLKKINSCQTDIEKAKIELKNYRKQCAFRFSIKQFPHEFDLSLIQKYGWYKAKNHGNNLNGVSRDHKYSILDGFLNHVDPKIISHPANCELMCHSKNSSKHSKSSISLEKLLDRIKIWENKYGVFE